jgi:hypothetical protein
MAIRLIAINSLIVSNITDPDLLLTAIGSPIIITTIKIIITTVSNQDQRRVTVISNNHGTTMMVIGIGDITMTAMIIADIMIIMTMIKSAFYCRSGFVIRIHNPRKNSRVIELTKAQQGKDAMNCL